MIGMIGFFYIIALVAMIVASYTDLRTREVPDLWNYGLVFFAVFARLIFFAVDKDTSILIEGLIGGAAAFAFGTLMYYTGQWGGGDTKMIFGLGTLIGLPLRLEFSFFTLFMINIFFVGAIYALLFAAYFAFRNKDAFKKEFIRINYSLTKIKYFLLAFVVLSILAGFFVESTQIKLALFSLVVLFAAMIYLYAFVKAVEKSAMLKEYPIEKLTEGDWIARDVFVDKKRICGPKDLGVSKEQIALLKKYKSKKKINVVLVKEGIPFVPSFLIAFIVTYYLGAWFFGFF